MSFSANLKTELVDIQFKKNCCKKAFLLGLLQSNIKFSLFILICKKFCFQNILAFIVDVIWKFIHHYLKLLTSILVDNINNVQNI